MKERESDFQGFVFQLYHWLTVGPFVSQFPQLYINGAGNSFTTLYYMQEIFGWKVQYVQRIGNIHS